MTFTQTRFRRTLIQWVFVTVAWCAGPMCGDDSRVSRQEDSKAASDKAKPEKKKPNRTMHIKVFGPDGKPLAGANVHRAVWTKQNPFKANSDVVTDGKGQVHVDLPATFYILRLWARKDGFVPLFAHWEQEELADGDDIVPEEFAFHLRKGTTIGGVVHNEDGKPIKGAKVEVRREYDTTEERERTIFGTWLATGDAARVTDAQGFWMLDNVPPGDDSKVRVKLSHPKYINDQTWGGLQRDQRITMKSLRDLSSTIVMRRGISVTGTVTDPKGKPVVDAVVVWGDDPYFQTGSQEVRTDKKGVYRFPPLPPGVINVTVIGKGWAPTIKEIDVSPVKSRIDFELKRGVTIRIRFVDGAGKPVPRVYVGINGWRGSMSLFNHKHPNVLDTKIPRKSNMNGLYEWKWAPEDNVTYSFYKEGYLETRNQSLAARDEEYEVRLIKKQN